MKIFCFLLGLLMVGVANAQTLEVGQNGWELERLSNELVLLRTSIYIPKQGDRPDRQGLLILTCERGVRRVRFQMGGLPRRPSINPSSQGRAIIRGWHAQKKSPSGPVHASVDFFDDGSFEFLERSAFSDPVMRGILELLRKTPDRLEIVLFKGPDTHAFRTGAPIQFRLIGLLNDLGNIYAFEGLCFHSDQ
jgi:hypothetical protein